MVAKANLAAESEHISQSQLDFNPLSNRKLELSSKDNLENVLKQKGLWNFMEIRKRNGERKLYNTNN